MISVIEVRNEEIVNKIEEFKKLGGVVDFKIFKIEGAAPRLDKHRLIAEKTLELLKQDCDAYFDSLAILQGRDRAAAYYEIKNKPVTLNTGNPISKEQFFGPFFDIQIQRPILLGVVGEKDGAYTFFNHYYYYDDIESSENIVTINRNPSSEFITEGYADAFLRPVHRFGGQMNNYDIGRYFLEFKTLLFDDINNIAVFSWDNSLSNYFDSGKEFWGSFFWTVYNPLKNWYIGITASTTD